MPRGKKNIKTAPYINLISQVLFLPLFFFKGFGEVIINLIRIIISFFLKSYKLLKSLRLPKSPKGIKKKRGIIYHRKPSLAEKINKKILILKKKIFSFRIRLPKITILKFSLPKFTIPKLKFKFPKRKRLRIRIKIPRALKIVFLKIKYFFLGALVVLTITVFYQLKIFIQTIPNPRYLTVKDPPTTTKIYDRNDKLLYEIYAEQNRTPIKLADVPETVIQATIATEDKDFYFHKGFSVSAIIRALIHNLTTDTIEGGSTITQQLIRSALLNPDRTVKRKIQEIILSVWAEGIYSKDQILEMYLNQVPYGGTAWGIEAAAQTYFGKSIKELTLSETALLAGLPAAPSRFSPYGIHPELAKQRQEEVLKRMTDEGYINKETADQAAAETLNYNNPRTAILAPHFVMYVKEELERLYGLRIVETGGLRVKTTLDLNLQEMAQKIVTENINGLKNLNVGNGAILITDPKTGEILSMVGSTDYFDLSNQGNVNVTTALRQPGSSIKVVNYAAALTRGMTAATMIDDTPITYKVAGQAAYAPVNYDGRYHGRVTLRTALGSSYNIPAVKTLARIGLKAMIEQGKLMGITSWNDESRFGLSLTLGGGDVTMLDMTKVYGSLANAGERADLTPFLKITDYKGEVLPLPEEKTPVKATSPEIAYIISNILSDNLARTPAFGPSSSLVIPSHTVAVKTGTSDNKRDNWTIGYTGDFVVTVWVGNNDGSPMNPRLTSGVTGAAPIWQQIMKEILKNKEDKPFVMPKGIIAFPCYGRTEYFVSGTQPVGGCPTLIPASPSPSIKL